MIIGTLIVNLDPPCLAFFRETAGSGSGNGCCRRSCTSDEVRALLLDLGAIYPYQSWPICEYQALLRGSFSEVTLAKHELVSMFENRIKRQERQLMRVSGGTDEPP